MSVGRQNRELLSVSIFLETFPVNADLDAEEVVRWSIPFARLYYLTDRGGEQHQPKSSRDSILIIYFQKFLLL